MKIKYDSVSKDYLYPLGDKKDINSFLKIVPDHIFERIIKIRFGCNWKTTQEARVVQRGKNFDIRINFCLKENRTPVLSNRDDWIKTVKKFGGIIDKERNEVVWSINSAKRYSLFLIMHEVGHIEYCVRNHNGRISDKKGSHLEDQWCESYALEAMNNID